MSDLFANEPVSLSEQVGELERELKQRARVYPRFVADGRLTQARADYQVKCLRAALATVLKAIQP